MPLLNGREARTIRWGAERIPHPQLLKDFNVRSPTFQPFNLSLTLLHLPRLVALNILGNLQRIKAIDGNSKVMIQYVHNSQFANGGLI